MCVSCISEKQSKVDKNEIGIDNRLVFVNRARDFVCTGIRRNTQIFPGNFKINREKH